MKIPIPHEFCQDPPGAFLRMSDLRAYLARCMKWTCEKCARIKSWKATKALAGQQFNWLITFTAPAEFKNASRAEVMALNRQWKVIAQWLRRKHPPMKHPGTGIEEHGHFSPRLTGYLWSNERGDEKGHLHKHLVCRIESWFCFACLRKAIFQAGFGIVCDFKQVNLWDASKAVGYVAKYITKGSNWAFPRYSRRFQRSRGILPTKTVPSEKWLYLKRSMNNGDSIEVLAPNGATCGEQVDDNDRGSRGNVSRGNGISGTQAGVCGAPSRIILLAHDTG